MLEIIETFPGWPSDDSHSVLGTLITPEEFSSTIGSPLDRAEDDLGPFSITYFKLDEIGPVAIIRYDRSPKGFSDFFVDSNADVLRSEMLIVNDLSLRPEDICWCRSQDTSPFINAFEFHPEERKVNKVMDADAYFGRAATIIKQRERIKRQTIEHRRLQHRKHAA